jgi:hypothetical protein
MKFTLLGSLNNQISLSGAPSNLIFDGLISSNPSGGTKSKFMNKKNQKTTLMDLINFTKKDTFVLWADFLAINSINSLGGFSKLV